MKTFKDLEFKPHRFHPDGVTSRIHFSNGYGVSVVRHEASYGNERGLYELAVLDAAGELVYNTPITEDTIGWLRPEDVTDVMKKVQELPELIS